MQGEQLTQAAIVLLLLRSFASGCSALTGVEAIANGVPAFRLPKVKNAQRTLVLMGGIAIMLFVGLTALALISQRALRREPVPPHRAGRTAPPSRSARLIAQVAAAMFGNNSILFFVIQAATALVLLLAANTAFNGFPLLGSVLARDGYAPKSLSTRGDRLIYSNGVLLLGLAAVVILVVFQANLTVLIQLYIIGVFVSFTLGQSGMVRHWLARAEGAGRTDRGSIIKSLTINALGAVHDRRRAHRRDHHEVHPRRLDRLRHDADPVLRS